MVEPGVMESGKYVGCVMKMVGATWWERHPAAMNHSWEGPSAAGCRSHRACFCQGHLTSAARCPYRCVKYPLHGGFGMNSSGQQKIIGKVFLAIGLALLVITIMLDGQISSRLQNVGMAFVAAGSWFVSRCRLRSVSKP
jgi:hypothetical protein